MKKLLPLLLALAAIVVFYPREALFDSALSPSADNTATSPSSAATDPLRDLFERRQSNQLIDGVAVVKQLLADDNRGSRHQRFIVETASGLTVLIAHNIDLAPRIDDLRVGETIAFRGEYEWNEKGGVVHWTHRDPARRHRDGWLQWRDKRYE